MPTPLIRVSAQACRVAGLRDRAGDLTYSSYGPFSTYTRGARAHILYRQGQQAPPPRCDCCCRRCGLTDGRVSSSCLRVCHDVGPAVYAPLRGVSEGQRHGWSMRRASCAFAMWRRCPQGGESVPAGVWASDMGHGALWVIEPVHTVPITQVAVKRQHESCEVALRCRRIQECQRRGVCTHVPKYCKPPRSWALVT